MAMTRGAGVAALRCAAAVVVAFVLAVSAAVLPGCGPDDSKLAARYDGGVVTEEEVNDYTAQFRQRNGYEDDETWALYLFGEELTAVTWRQQAIGSIIEERLVEREAQSQGIVADEQRIDEQIAQDKEAAGIDEGDVRAWADYLQSRGMTEQEYRDELRQVSIESQLYNANVGLDAVSDAAVLDEYIQQNNLVSRVVRRYRVCGFWDRESAERVLGLLEGVTGDELESEFIASVLLDSSDATTVDNGGDIGWDIASSWTGLIAELNDEMLAEGEVSSRVHEYDGLFYVAQCTGRYVFTYDSTYDALPDDALRDYIYRSALYANWNDMIAEYVSGLLDAAHVQMKAASGALPYDVDERVAEMEAQVSK